jgi:hypothetical protein
MAKSKQILVAFCIASAVSSMQFLAATRFAGAILWQVVIMQYLVGHGPILGYRNGQPIYEGTPVHEVAAYVGLGLGVIVYWLASYLIIKKWHNHLLHWNANSLAR